MNSSNVTDSTMPEPSTKLTSGGSTGEKRDEVTHFICT